MHSSIGWRLGKERGRILTGEVHRVEAEVYEFNEASLHLLTSLGFKREGVKRQAHFDGEAYCDIVVMGLLAKDFENRGQVDS